jgi:hypothetical protein
MIRHRLRSAAAWVVLILVEVGLRVLPLRIVARIAGVRLLEEGSGTGASLGSVELPWWAGERVAAAHRVVARWPHEGPCLRRGLVAGALLRRFDPVLRLGVARSGSGRLAAHAWIEVGGATFDATTTGYAPLEPVGTCARG